MDNYEVHEVQLTREQVDSLQSWLDEHCNPPEPTDDGLNFWRALRWAVPAGLAFWAGVVWLLWSRTAGASATCGRARSASSKSQ